MARIEDASILRHIRGAIGDSVVVRQIRGKAHLCLSPTFTKGKRSAKQLDSQDRFKEATMYAKEITKVPAYKKAYSAAVGEKFSNAYGVALADYLSRPIIHRVEVEKYNGKVGDKILVEATDDFHVASVFVVISNRHGEIIENGHALRDGLNQDEWMYSTTVENAFITGTKIKVVAKDLPENTTIFEVEK